MLLDFFVVALAPYVGEYVRPLHALEFAPDLMSTLVLLYVLFAGARQGFQFVAGKYWAAFIAVALICGCGVIANGVSTGPLLVGLRVYLRAMPFFFLPAVCDFDDEQLTQQLRVLLLLALLQFPVAVYQRWEVFSHGKFSGDGVQGTVLDSGVLSIFLISAAQVLTGKYLRGQLELRRLLLLLCIVLFPTSINETKVTAIYVPLAFLITVLIGAEKGRKGRMVLSYAAFLLAFGTLFVFVYNLMEINNPYKHERNIVGFYTNEKQIDRYMSAHVTTVGTTTKDVRRLDAVSIPLEYLERDPIHLMLGLGLGNTSSSSFGRAYEGRYHQLFGAFLLTSFTSFILEIGLLGVGALLVLYALIFFDALALTASPGPLNGFAVGWCAVTVLLCVSLAYSPIHLNEALSYFFWYLAGVVAMRRAKTAVATSAARPVPVATGAVHP